ncbi:MAG: uridine diphosphate-N-acetylglucosamine-binding protein YvcK [Acidimicrobiia bacterium]|nr:uridine diphosphate-N-acetylglucosamine-binding protein YvcK [Acidimicrobiia bacterium]
MSHRELATDTTMELEPDPLLAALEAELVGPNVVAIGGGHGLAQALMAIRRYAGTVQAIVTVADDGGSSGRLAPGLDIPPPGDIRQCLIALTPDTSVWRQLFDYRFEGSDVAGHSLGNLIIAALTDIEGSFEDALRQAEILLRSVGSVIPAAQQRLHLEAVVDGAPVSGQVAIARSRGPITELFATPRQASATPRAVEAIQEAEQIVLGPGSLYTSVMAALVVPGIVEAINESGAKLIYVSNLITQDGETLDMDGADHLEALLGLTGVRSPSAIVANDAAIDIAPPLAAIEVDAEAIATYGVDVVMANLVDPEAPWPSHHPATLGDVLARLT